MQHINNFLPAESAAIATDVDSTGQMVRKDGHECADVAMPASQFEVPNESHVVFHQTENIT